MAQTKSLMQLGMPSNQAADLGFIGTEATGLTATGTTSSDALQLTTGVNVFSTVASGAGAKLCAQGGMHAVVNGGLNALLVYPPTGAQINGGTVTTGSYSVANGKTAIFIKAGSRYLATLST